MSSVLGQQLPTALLHDIEQAGYYPHLVADVVAAALAGGQVRSHLVHQETTLDAEQVRRHITVLALTDQVLVIAHADDHAPDPTSAIEASSVATASTETVPLRSVRGCMLTHVVPTPDRYQQGSLGLELTLTIGWGTISRIDLMPGTCGDPTCEADDHGYEGTVTGDDISVRVSAAADGPDVLARAHEFAGALSAAVGRS